MPSLSQIAFYLMCTSLVVNCIQTEYESDVDEETRQFILDQNEETRRLIANDVSSQHDRLSKSVMDAFNETINKLSDNLDKKLAEVVGKQEEIVGKEDKNVKKQNEIFANQQEMIGKQDKILTLQQNIVEKQDEIVKKQDEIFGKQKGIFGKQDKIYKMQEEVVRKQDEIFGRQDEIVNMQEKILGKPFEIVRKQKEAQEKLDNLTQTVHQYVHRRYPINSFDQTESPFVLDALKFSKGAIVFNGNDMSWRKRRFWILENAGTVWFTLLANDLKSDSRLTISGLKSVEWNSTDDLEEVYINSATAPRTVLSVSGVVILVTMSQHNKMDEKEVNSSFVLQFFCLRNDAILLPGRTLYPSSFGTGEGQEVASFPEKNALNYTNNANHLMVISREDGRDFNLKLTFMDIDGPNDYYRRYEIEETENKTRFRLRWKVYGKVGRVHSTRGPVSVAILFFKSDGSGSGKGYEYTID